MDFLLYLQVPPFNEIPGSQQLLFPVLQPELHVLHLSLPLPLLMVDHDINLSHQLLKLWLT